MVIEEDHPNASGSMDGESSSEAQQAVTVTTFEAGHQIEIQLGHFCNNRCVFCVSGQLTQDGVARPIGTEPVFRALEQAAARGIRRVTFLGGEPTIQKSFLPSLKRALALGFDDIVIFTNGAMGRTPRFLDEVLALGDFTWRFSIQGGDEQTHDSVTLRTRSFARIEAALAYLSARGQDITANMCVNSRSYRSLPAYVDLVRRYGIRQLHIDLVRPESAGRRTAQELRDMIPRLTDMVPYVREMLDGFDKELPGFDVNLGNLPWCLLPEHADRIHHGGEPTLTLTTGQGGELNTILAKYAFQAVDATYGAACNACVFRSGCRGVTERYAAIYGTEELVAVSANELSRRDPRQRAFTHEAGPWLALLAEAGAPAEMVLTEVHRDSRRRRVTLSCRLGQTQSRLHLVPVVDASADGPVLVRSERFGLMADGPQAMSVLRWAVEVFKAAGMRLWRVRPENRRDGLGRLAAGVRRLKHAPLTGGWQLARMSRRERAVKVELVGPGEAAASYLMVSTAAGLSFEALVEGPSTLREELLAAVQASRHLA